MNTNRLTTFIHSTTARVGASYLAIIMLLSIGFSIVFYETAVNEVGTQIHAIITLPNIGAVGMDNGLFPLEGRLLLNQAIQQHIDQARNALLVRLILLNISALALGGSFSYYWARRTLQPIERAVDAQTRFSSDASHELRTPLAALRARNEVALRNPKLTVSEAIGVIKDSIQEAIKLEKLADGLLRVAREDRNVDISTTASLNDVTTEAINQVVQAALTKNITISETVPPILVKAESQSLSQVLTIFLDNAIKYSDPEKAISIEGHQDKRWGYIAVKDQGRGIRATDLPHIFDRFYRSDHSRTKHGEHGYGLGLAIAKKIVELYNGEIIVRSALGHGATFTVKLPLAKK